MRPPFQNDGIDTFETVVNLCLHCLSKLIGDNYRPTHLLSFCQSCASLNVVICTLCHFCCLGCLQYLFWVKHEQFYSAFKKKTRSSSVVNSYENSLGITEHKLAQLCATHHLPVENLSSTFELKLQVAVQLVDKSNGSLLMRIEH